MINRTVRSPLPYVMDLETGISFRLMDTFPRARGISVSADAIRSGAYLLWGSEGRLDNHRLVNWLDAGSELRIEDTSVRARDIPSAPVQARPQDGWPRDRITEEPAYLRSREQMHHVHGTEGRWLRHSRRTGF